ncbi:hypothetical protein BDZ85DRAFT_277990 [Elsinoe ampelina]|uniref:BTB domain-containing protein n=1 Tax=Elsinoe ampelina TaxID=302913 RepID=A0A6A6GRB9_9PEZI|nr:hypothetical protein BDZ85DRAFT_277990 [Elsinoe ampelina]
MEEYIIVEDGDTVLVAQGVDTEVAFCVSSTTLKARCSSLYSHSLTRSKHSQSPHRLPDDPELLRTLLHCIHDTRYSFTLQVDTKELLQLILLADKYDCIPTLHTFILDQHDNYMRRNKNSKHDKIESLLDLLNVGYLSGHAEVFSSCTRTLVATQVKGYHELCRSSGPRIPDFVLLWLEIARTRLREAYQIIILQALHLGCRNVLDECEPIGGLNETLEDHFDWMSSWSFEHMAAKHAAFVTEAEQDASRCDDCSLLFMPAHVMSNDELEAAKAWKGLCVLCCHARARDPFECDGKCEDKPSGVEEGVDQGE